MDCCVMDLRLWMWFSRKCYGRTVFWFKWTARVSDIIDFKNKNKLTWLLNSIRRAAFLVCTWAILSVGVGVTFSGCICVRVDALKMCKYARGNGIFFLSCYFYGYSHCVVIIMVMLWWCAMISLPMVTHAHYYWWCFCWLLLLLLLAGPSAWICASTAEVWAYPWFTDSATTEEKRI